MELRREALRLAEEFRGHNRVALLNLLSDSATALTGFALLLRGSEGRGALFRTIGRLFSGFSDTAKAFLIIASAPLSHPQPSAPATSACGQCLACMLCTGDPEYSWLFLYLCALQMKFICSHDCLSSTIWRLSCTHVCGNRVHMWFLFLRVKGWPCLMCRHGYPSGVSL